MAKPFAPDLPAKEQILGALSEVIQRCTGCKRAAAEVAARQSLDALQAPARSWGQRCLAAQEAADVIGHELIEALKNEMLIVLVERLGGKVVVAGHEIDTVPAGRVLSLNVDAERAQFTFENRRKQ